MISVSQKVKLISKCFGSYSLSSDGKNISVVCPFCLKSGKITKKKKLSIDLETGMYHCWVCEAKGKNVARVGHKFCSNRALVNELHEHYGHAVLKEEDIEEEKAELPADFQLITKLSMTGRLKFGQHINYLKNRGLTKNDLDKFCVGVSEEFEYRNHVIFPSFDISGQLNYYVARSIDTLSFRRYKNCKVSRKQMIFRHFNVDFSKELVLVEGVFDLINCPENSTCLLGSWFDDSYLLFKEIVKHNTPVVLCLDADAEEKAMKICQLLKSYCIPVRIIETTERDFGDMSKQEVLQIINSAKHYDFAHSVRYLIQNINSGSLF